MIREEELKRESKRDRMKQTKRKKGNYSNEWPPCDLEIQQYSVFGSTNRRTHKKKLSPSLRYQVWQSDEVFEKNAQSGTAKENNRSADASSF